MNPNNADNLKEVAKCLYKLRRFKLALKAYLEAELHSKYGDWHLYYYIAQCYWKLRDLNQAKDYAHKSVKVAKQEESYAILVKILLDEGDIKSAVSVANAAVESCPDSAKMFTESGLLYLKIGQNQHAFERLSQALALDPTCSRALFGIGCITQMHQEYDVALTKYKIAVPYEPDSISLWNNIGICFYSKQKYVAAISCLKKGLWISPCNWTLLFNLGLVYLATSQTASAFNFACAAVNFRPDVAECFELLAYVLLELKDLENAQKAIRQACILAPSNTTTVINAAVVLHVAGSSENASIFLKKFEELVSEGQTLSNEILELAEKLRLSLRDAPGEHLDPANKADQSKNDTAVQSSDERLVLNGDEV
ncbi:Bardet-Biedl syndrome 4 protein isoform X2 [Cylas formicarius]|nr:Bardet-Biedl syndrome 4 protein isoform X2 [Cylas formicarius]